jgi:hypothetical protein
MAPAAACTDHRITGGSIVMRRLGVVATAAAVLTMLVAAPVAAGPPERVDEPIFGILLDEERELVVFLNIDRDAFCDWVADDFEGPAPVNELVEVKSKVTGKGAIVESFQTTMSVDLWALDPDAELEDACEDTDAQESPWATGTLRVTSNDNDLEVSGTRMNSFGARGQGVVHDVDGNAWRLSFNFRAQITRDGEFRLLVDRLRLL